MRAKLVRPSAAASPNGRRTCAPHRKRRTPRRARSPCRRPRPACLSATDRTAPPRRRRTHPCRHGRSVRVMACHLAASTRGIPARSSIASTSDQPPVEHRLHRFQRLPPSSRISHPPGRSTSRACVDKTLDRFHCPSRRRTARRAARGRALRVAVRRPRAVRHREGSKRSHRTIAAAKAASKIARATNSTRCSELARIAAKRPSARPREMSYAHTSARRFERERDRDRAGPAADIDDTSPLERTRSSAAVTTMLGFGAGNQHVGRDREVAPVEFLLLGDVLRRLAASSAGADSGRSESRRVRSARRVE